MKPFQQQRLDTDREKAMKNVIRLGAHRAANRGFYDRYQCASVLSAANSSQTSIDKKMAEQMTQENQEMRNHDLVMIPSMQSNTGWTYVQAKKLEQIRKKRAQLLPGLKGAINTAKLEPIAKGDPNQMFPDMAQAMGTGGFLKDTQTGLQANFKITQRGGAMLPSPEISKKRF